MAAPEDRMIPIESPVGESAPLLSGEEREDDTINLFNCWQVPRGIFNIVALGFIFMLLFTAFAPSQNLQSTVNDHSKAGLYALGALYFTFAFANFIAPTVAFLLGERIAMLIGGIGYFLFVASNIMDHKASYFLPLFVMGGVMNGLGAAILWTGQGSYITKNSTQSTMGRNNGIFFGLFQISQVAGNLIAAFVLPPKGTKLEFGPVRRLFIIFASIAGVAVVSFLILRQPPRSSLREGKKQSVISRFTGIFKMFTKPAFLLMILSIIYSGLSQAYFAGNFTKLVVESKNVGYVMACFGGVDAVASVIIGRALDRFGRRAILFFSTFFVLVTTGIICLVDQTYFANHLWLPLICAACAGISDAGYNTLLTATTGALFEDDPENAFGAFKFIQAITSAINYVAAMDIYIATLVLDIFLILGTCSFFFLAYLHPRKPRQPALNLNADD